MGCESLIRQETFAVDRTNSLPTVNMLGLVLGPLIGGAFTTYSTWRWCTFSLSLSLPG